MNKSNIYLFLAVLVTIAIAFSAGVYQSRTETLWSEQQPIVVKQKQYKVFAYLLHRQKEAQLRLTGFIQEGWKVDHMSDPVIDHRNGDMLVVFLLYK